MEEEKKEELQAPTEEVKEEATEAVDYDKELAEALAESAKKEEARQAYASRHANESNDSSASDDSADAIADRVISKILPKLQSTAESSSLDMKLEKIAGDNESLKKLVKLHYEETTNPSLDMDSRVEAAYAIANKKVIERRAKEINISLQNRSQISNSGLGQSQEQHQIPGANVLSEAQLNDLKKFAKHNYLDEKKFIERAILNMRTGK